MLLLQEFDARLISGSLNLEIGQDRIVRLKPGAAMGWLITGIYYPRLLNLYCGFEVSPSEQGIQVSLINEQGEECFWSGALWQAGAILNTPEEVRQGISAWSGSLAVKLYLNRLNEGISALFKSVRLGAEVIGNGGSIRSYILSYGLPDILSTPVELTRWVDDPIESPTGVNLPNIIDRAARPFGDHHLLTFHYRCLVENVFQEYQVTEAPCILLRSGSTRNQRRMNEVDSIRLPENKAKLLSLAFICDQPIEITVIAENPEDVAAICDHIVTVIEAQNYIDVPPYDLRIGCAMSGGIRTEEPIAAILEGQLPSAMMEVVLFSLPMGASEFETGILTGIEKPLIN